MRRDQQPDDAGLRATPGSVEQNGAFPTQLRRLVADLVLETTAEAIWLIDADARTTFVNRRLAQLLGYTEEEMVGRFVFEFIDRDRWPQAQRNLRLRQQGVAERVEFELVRKDGSRVWLLGSANAVFDREGRYAGGLAVFGDLSEQKQREASLRAQISELQARAEAARPAVGNPPVGNPPGSPAAERQPPTYREPFRTAIVLGMLGAIFATVAVTTVGALAAGFLDGDKQEES